MFKKIFISSFLVLSMLGFYRASAFLDKSVGGAYTGSVTYSGLHVVSAGDFADTIYFEATSSPNTILNLVGNFGSGFQPLSPNSTITTDANGLAHTYANYTWPEEDLSSEYTYQAQFRASDNSDNQSSIAYYKAKVSYASININNDKSITQNATVPKGTIVNFSCSGASEMYFGQVSGWPGNAALVASDYGPHVNTGDYALAYTATLNTNGNFRLECDNIGGTNTRKRLNFTVAVVCPAGEVADINDFCHVPCAAGSIWDASIKQCVANSSTTFDILNITSSPNLVQTKNTFNWDSGADTCNLYTADKATKLSTGSLPGEGASWVATLNAAKAPTLAGAYGYYVKCYSATKAPAASLEADASDPAHTGWKNYTATMNCPIGQIADNNGYCHAPCASGTTWNESTKQCDTTTSCPIEGQIADSNGYCHYPCQSGFIWNEDMQRCISITCQKNDEIDSNGYCHSPCPTGTTWNESTRQCEGACPKGQIADSNGYCHPPCPTGTTWNESTKQCEATGTREDETYSHFLAFNLSASNVNKGSGIDMNWSVEDPNSSCSIQGVSIKNGNTIFDSLSNQTLNSQIATATILGSSRILAVGDYYDIFGTYWVVNESTRFTASCTNTGSYKPGFYKLVRDIYITNDSER